MRLKMANKFHSIEIHFNLCCAGLVWVVQRIFIHRVVVVMWVFSFNFDYSHFIWKYYRATQLDERIYLDSIRFSLLFEIVDALLIRVLLNSVALISYKIYYLHIKVKYYNSSRLVKWILTKVFCNACAKRWWLVWI